MKRILKPLGLILLTAVILLVINFIPAFRKLDSDMTTRSNDYFNFHYYESDMGAEAVYDLALTEAPRIINTLQLTDTDPINIYLYPDQTQMQSKHIGYAAYLVDLPWYIGGANQNDIAILSPEAENDYHDYESILVTVVHEVGHAYNYQLNPDMDLWLDEGATMVLSGQGDGARPGDERPQPIPTFEQVESVSTLNFQAIDGYFYARLYADYLIQTYGHDAWLQLLRTNDYTSTYGKAHETIYNEWHQATVND